MTPPPRQAPDAACNEIDVTLRCDDWPAGCVKACLPAARAALAAPSAEGVRAAGVEVSIVLADDALVRKLNRRYRQCDESTDVLAFPADASPGSRRHLGDVIIARETVRRDAVRHNRREEEHVSHLVVHGMLHLLGYDHHTPDDATRMEGLESRILLDLGMRDPWDSCGSGESREAARG